MRLAIAVLAGEVALDDAVGPVGAIRVAAVALLDEAKLGVREARRLLAAREEAVRILRAAAGPIDQVPAVRELPRLHGDRVQAGELPGVAEAEVMGELVGQEVVRALVAAGAEALLAGPD